ncbi:MAG: zinc-binding alcohol dehydrogenase family protein [Candidatus Lokiarchaeota archaeon]|nr:zinc-binding alcohol dehydrogenase family protein [Candidatus Lokiarchaeota archaeon]
MKAMVLNEPKDVHENPLSLEDVAKPIIKKDEILIKVSRCGACHTDLHEVEGELELPKLPIILGHEVIGHIEETGSSIKDLKNGDRVGVPWLYSADNTCKYCKRDQQNLCPNAKFTGFSVNGGYAEYMKSKKGFTYKIPDGFSDEKAAPLMCAGVIGYRSIRLSEVKPGERLGLFGFGASAHIVIQVANHWDCETYVFTRSKNHQEHAKELGAKWVGTSKDDPPEKIDRAIIFAPAGPIVLDALRVLDKGGTLAINAIYLSDIPPISWDLLWHERKIVSVANVTPQDAIDFLKIAPEIPIKTDTVLFPLEKANKALIDMKESKFNGAAVLKIN